MSEYVVSIETTATGVTLAGPAYVSGFVLTGGSDAASAVIYDHATAASGTIVATIKVAAASTNSILFNSPMYVRNGLYMTITGTAPKAYTYYS